jgi:small G protein signaling modulator 3
MTTDTTRFLDADCVFNSFNPKTSPDRLHDIDFLCNPAFTEASWVSCSADVFPVTVRRLYDGAMDLDATFNLQRSSSHHSNNSTKSRRSPTVRAKPRKYASYTSSSASSVTPSDKSLTSFPAISLGSPTDKRMPSPTLGDEAVNGQGTSSRPSFSIVDSLTSWPSEFERAALFDEPLSTQRVPGAIHNATDKHIERLIARNGAVTLVRQIAEDLALRDAQMAALRRKTDLREKALRRVVLECGLSNLDLESRLRVIEGELRAVEESRKVTNSIAPELEGLIYDAMGEDADFGDPLEARDTSIKVAQPHPTTDPTKEHKGTVRGWKDYLWGGTSRRSDSKASSINGDVLNESNQTYTRNSRKLGNHGTILQNGIFQPPGSGSVRSPSTASSIRSGNPGQERMASSSLASLALKLVAGNANGGRDTDSTFSGRGRANSATAARNGRTSSLASTRTSISAKIPPKQDPKNAPTTRRISTISSTVATSRLGPQERWDTMAGSPQGTLATGIENYGPVEMDTILPLEVQPPTLTQVYNNHHHPEFLTDRFGFIYDQRRKKRQKEAAEIVQKMKSGGRREMLTTSRTGIPSSATDVDIRVERDQLDGRPDTPTSNDDRGEDGKPTKRWQDYLKIATFPTELLSHMPAGSTQALEVLEGDEGLKSPVSITSEERGFVPAANTAAASPVSVVSENATISKPTTTQATSPQSSEDTEPVKLLLEQLSEVHDSLQRDKTVKWNDFLRKVRAERRREGEALAAAESRSQRAIAVMPEASLADGEMIGVACLGNKGKVGRAKWNEFKLLVLGGIPVAYRAKIWAECSGANAMRIPGYYEDLVVRNGSDDDPVIVAQIQMDINRTLTDNIFFRRGPGVQKLNEVLLAYSRRNAEVGYCQGMNLITACLLLIMPAAEDAFWVLTSIIENILPQGYYDHSLLASRADQQVLRQYVAAILPKLSVHLDELGIELEALTFQWFLSVFTDCLSAEALFRVWDVVLCTNDGNTFLFQVALALLKLNEQQLLQCQTPANIYTYINHQMTNHAISIDGLIHASEGLRKVVKREDVEARRAKAIEAEKDLMQQREARNALLKVERLAAVTVHAAGAVEIESVSTPPLKKSPSQLDDVAEYSELTVRVPVPLEEEVGLGLG